MINIHFKICFPGFMNTFLLIKDCSIKILKFVFTKKLEYEYKNNWNFINY